MQYELSLLGTRTELKTGDTGEINLLEGSISFFRGDRVLFLRPAGSKVSTLRGLPILSAKSEPMSREEADHALGVIGTFARLCLSVIESDDLVIRFLCGGRSDGIGGKFTKNDEVHLDEKAGRIRLIRGGRRRSSDERVMEWDLFPLDPAESGAWIDLFATLVRQDLRPLREDGSAIVYGVQAKERTPKTPAMPNLQQEYGARKPGGRGKLAKWAGESPTGVRKNLSRLRDAGKLPARPSVRAKPREDGLARLKSSSRSA